MTDAYGDLPFDPSYGYDPEGLLTVEPPPEPAGFRAFWSARYERALAVDIRFMDLGERVPRLAAERHA